MGRAGNAGKNAGSSTIKETRAAVTTRGSSKADQGPLTIAISAAAKPIAKTARKNADRAGKSPKERAAGKQI